MGGIKRIDNKPIDYKELGSILDGLNDYLSFTMGRWVPVAFPTGLDQDDNIVWQCWTIGLCDRFLSRLSWFDWHHAQTLESVYKGFMKCWSDPLWKKAIHDVIYWYILSNDPSRGSDTGIVLAQIALEKLAWNYLVIDKKAISEKRFNALTASNRLRLLCSHLSIPQDIPKECMLIKDLKNDPMWDSLWAITEFRNAIVHPKEKEKMQEPDVLYEAWDLSLWRLELVLLRLFDCQDQYANRLTKGKWVGDVERLPWDKNDNKAK